MSVSITDLRFAKSKEEVNEYVSSKLSRDHLNRTELYLISACINYNFYKLEEILTNLQETEIGSSRQSAEQSSSELCESSLWIIVYLWAENRFKEHYYNHKHSLSIPTNSIEDLKTQLKSGAKLKSNRYLELDVKLLPILELAVQKYSNPVGLETNVSEQLPAELISIVKEKLLELGCYKFVYGVEHFANITTDHYLFAEPILEEKFIYVWMNLCI